jgi:hypothetical protein
MHNDQQYLTTQQTFALQYITVMIIILAFLVGTFSSRSIKKKAEAASLAAVVEAPAQPEINLSDARASLKSTLEYSDFFMAESSELISEKVEPLAALLANHDLIADINLNLGLCKKDNSDSCFKREMKGAKNLSDFLLSKGLPYDSFEIYYAPELEGVQAKITLLTEEHGI